MGLQNYFYYFYYTFIFFEYAIIAYVAVINLIYLLMMTLGYFVLRRHHVEVSAAEQDALFRSPLVPAVSVLAPAYNEAATIRDSVRAMLNLRYPNHEVVVINDGSKDETLAILIEEFHLYRSSRIPSGDIPTMPIRRIYESRDPIRLVVIDKENGGKADSLNAGLNVSRSPLVAAVDADSLLEPDALLTVVRPFLEDPERTIAAGGIVRVANGCEVAHGKVNHIATPRSMLARIQAVEYLRAFLGGRVAFGFLNSLFIISGAFGLFRRDIVIAAGGFEPATVGEDMELVVKLHRHCREKKIPYRIVFMPEPVCWTEVPENWQVLQRQRNRWQRGTVETLRMHRKMLCNPRFGVLGLFTFPYFALFEMFGPLIELGGYLFTIIGLILGLVGIEVAILFFIVSILFGLLLSVSSLILEEMTLRRYPSVRDVIKLLGATLLENLGFRQILTVWRVKGFVDAIKGKQGWGDMQRRGFQALGKASQ